MGSTKWGADEEMWGLQTFSSDCFSGLWELGNEVSPAERWYDKEGRGSKERLGNCSMPAGSVKYS